MSRRIVACAALLALVVTLSACACPAVSKGGDGGSGADGTSGSTASSGTSTTSGTVCVPQKCVHKSDCTACYRSEAERNMARMVDDWPSGGCCCDCPVPVEKKREPKDCCAKK
jgi:hypothetical protein